MPINKGYSISDTSNTFRVENTALHLELNNRVNIDNESKQSTQLNQSFNNDNPQSFVNMQHRNIRPSSISEVDKNENNNSSEHNKMRHSKTKESPSKNAKLQLP